MDSIMLGYPLTRPVRARCWEFVQSHPDYGWLSLVIEQTGLSSVGILLPAGTPESFRRLLHSWVQDDHDAMPDPTGLISSPELLEWAAARRAQASRHAPRVLWRGDEPHPALRDAPATLEYLLPLIRVASEQEEKVSRARADLHRRTTILSPSAYEAQRAELWSQSLLLQQLSSQNHQAGLQFTWQQMAERLLRDPGLTPDVPVQPLSDYSELALEQYDLLTSYYVRVLAVWQAFQECYHLAPGTE